MRRWSGIVPMVVCAVMVATGCGARDRAERRATAPPLARSSTASATTNRPAAAPIVVNTDGLQAEITPGAMAKWAADVSHGQEAAVVAKCWTIAPQYIAERYFAEPATVATIFAQRPVSGHCRTLAWPPG